MKPDAGSVRKILHWSIRLAVPKFYATAGSEYLIHAIELTCGSLIKAMSVSLAGRGLASTCLEFCL